MTTVKTVAPQYRGIYAPRDDAAIFRDREMPERCKLERRIVWNLLRHLKANGWVPFRVDDGEEELDTRTPEAAMDAIFAVDDAVLAVRHADGGKARHTILLIGGNGVDIISDWGFFVGDTDGFSAVMSAFDAERFN